MASIQSKLLNFALRTINKRKFLSEKFASGKSGVFDCPLPPAKILKSCRVHTRQVNSRNVFTLSPLHETGGGPHILYLHGGAYVQNFILFHWEFMAEMIRKTGCTITAPDYPLAPDHTFEASFAMVEQLYMHLVALAPPARFLLMGDSAGGGFALSLAQKMRNQQVAQPSRIILLSPWLDITLSNSRIGETPGIHPLLGVTGLRKAGALYAGGADPALYLLSPVNGSLASLGTISLFIGTNDLLLADARKLRSLAAAEGNEIDYYEYEGMFHAWMFLNFPEAKEAKQQIADLISHPDN